MKTILEWYQELPEPYKSQAIANCDVELRNDTFPDSASALFGTFSWDISQEGFKYWDLFHAKLSN